MNILIKRHSDSPRFKPHFNRATDRYYHTARDYVRDLKARGLEPYTPAATNGHAPTPLTPSPWARAMVETIKAAKQKDGTVRVGDRFRAELAKRGVTLTPTTRPAAPITGMGGFTGG